MVFVSDGEAEKIGGYAQKQAELGLTNIPGSQPVAPQPDPFQNFQDTVNFAPPAVYGPFLPAAPDPVWQDFGNGQSGYVEPSSGNVWFEGNWYDPNSGNVWNEPANGWQTPGQYQDYWATLQQHEAAFPYPDVGESYNLFGGWSPFQPTPQTFDPGTPGAYNLDFLQPSPMLAQPEVMDPRGMAFQASQLSNSNPLLGGLTDFAGDVWDVSQQRRGQELGGFGFQGQPGGAAPADPLALNLEGLESTVSGNRLLSNLTPLEYEQLEGLPYGLGYLTDAVAAPINMAAVAAGPAVPIIGSTLGGNIARRAGAEVALDISARLAAEQAAKRLPEDIPLVPEWADPYARIGLTLGAGVVGGGLTAAGIKGLDAGVRNAPAMGRGLAETNPFAADVPGYPRGVVGAIDPETGRPFQWQALGGGADEVPEPPRITPEVPRAGTDAPAVMDARRSLLDALDKERAFRESGEAEALIRQGRATQAKGIAGSIGETRGGTFEEALAAASAGARTGPMLPSSGLDLPAGTLDALTKELQDYALTSGRNFDYLRSMKALEKLENGIHLQPGEIKMLGTVFGDEVERAIRVTNAGRIATVAELTPEDMTRITRMAEVDGKKAARAEVEAQAQHRLADDLDKRLRMDPTNKSLQRAAGGARARALKLEADSERYMLDRINRLEAEAKAKTQRAETLANREEVRQAELRDKRELKDLATKEYTESGAKALDRALAAIDKSDLPDNVKATARQVLERVVEADGAFLDRMKGDAPNFLRTVYAGAVGEVTDSWVSGLVEQRAVLNGVLQDMGFDRKTANTISKALSEMEVMRRWGPEPPPHIAKSLQQAKQSWADDSAIAGMANISQEWKNLMFGPMDIGIFGIQGLTGVQEGLVPILAATVNRVLNIVRLGVDTNSTSLTKRIAYGVDGRVRGGSAYAGAVAPTSGARATEASTLLRHVPGLQTFDKKVLSRVIGGMNDFQFRRVMGALGDYIHEGQLVMLKLTGSDITDPLVRQRSARWANSVTSAAKLSQRPGRAMVERAFPLSASMIRAQTEVIGGMMKMFMPGVARETRILAAATAFSYAASVMAIGKFLNDAIGTEEFEFNPTKRGFGQIRLSNGRVITPFPQTQLARLLLRSGRVIAEEGKGDQDAEVVAKAWLNFGLGRMSPALSMAAASAGVGFDSESGWRYGDLNEGKSWWEQARDNLLPTPPMAEHLIDEGLPTDRSSAMNTAFETVGLSNFQESEWSAREREIKADPRFQGRGWNELEEHEKAIVNAEQGRVYSRDPRIRAQQERADVIAGDAKAYQEKIDQWQLRGEKPDGTPYTVDDWKRDRAKNDRFTAGRYEELYAGVDWKKDDLNPVDRYYKAIADAVSPLTDEVDWDKVDAFRASLSPEDLAYIERNTNLRDTVLEQQYRQDVKLLSDSGYFDAENKVAVRKADPEIAAAVRRWGYSEMSVKAEDTVLRYTAQQEVDDRAFQTGQITAEQWRENYNQRRDQLRGAKESIYEGMKDDGVSTEPLDLYFDQIEKAVAPNGIDIDWTQVDTWLAQQPKTVHDAVNSYVSPGLTPIVDQYKQDVKKIAGSGYWDMDDVVTQVWAEAVGFGWSENQTADKFWNELNIAVVDMFKDEMGFAPLEAQALGDVAMGKLQNKYFDALGKVRAGMREADPELARLLVEWGYWTPGKEDTGKLIAAGTLQ